MTAGRSATLDALTEAGVSLWLDDLGRTRLIDGSLQTLVEQWSIRGITTNPSIFAAALKDSAAYDTQLAEVAAQGGDVEAAVRALTTTDVRDACDVLMPVHAATHGVDGKVSLEVDPRKARDTEGTVAEAAELWRLVDRPNLMIKIPATREGLPAIARTLAAGISVNVTLIFGLDRYAEVVEAFLAGLDEAHAAGRDLSTIESVASFFVSRVDTDVDAQLDAIGTSQAAAARGQAGLANARLAYDHHLSVLASDRWAALASHGARPQRPLWASTGVKDKAYPPTLYVSGLVASGTVNTLPEPTLQAAAAYDGTVRDTINGTAEASREVLAQLEKLGVSYQELVERLEDDGVGKFVAAWAELLTSVQNGLDAQR